MLRDKGRPMIAFTVDGDPQTKAWTLHLPIDLQSKNRAEFAQGRRAIAGIYAAQRNRYAAALFLAARTAKVAPLARFCSDPFRSSPPETAAVPFRRVTVVRLMGARQRAFDDDGFIAGAACLRDACQRERYGRGGRYIPGAGLVWDDSAKWSEWSYAQRKSDDGKPGVLLIVSDASEEKP